MKTLVPYWLWSWLLTTIGIIGLYLAGSKKRKGWAIGLASQGLWVIYALSTNQLGFLASAGVYGFVYARNYWLWKRSESSEG